ncbi:hypothetical protein BJ170DRAFT_672110 [Xylariales sp. AK1849]|nr:hypothetical protein BJ170DRAFT_672110 [Xylariales sp. AK1849]
MHPRKLLLERGSRDYICRSCRLGLQRKTRPAPARWGIRRSSQAAARQAATSKTTTQTVDDAERLRTMRKLGLLKDDQDQEEKFEVNYFEEADGGKLRRLKDEEQFTNSLTDPGGELSRDLEEMETGFSNATKLFDILEREDVQEQVEKLRDQLDPANNSNPNSETVKPSEDGGWKKNAREHIRHLNNNLQLAAKQLNRGKVNAMGFELWKFYSLARRTLATKWECVPPAAWEVLWDIFATESTKNPNRLNHVFNLAKDMSQAGVHLTDDRRLLAIEAMFMEGWREEAIENHRKLVTTLGTKPETFLAFWELGLRMYCQTGDLVRAERLADVIFDSPYQRNPRILYPLIRAYAEKPETVDKAYDTYERARRDLHTSMSIEDYDLVISYFLMANQTEKALWIFVDMMTSGSVDLRNMDKLPPSVANEFFVGKWLKRLIGNGDYDGAYNVLLHMKDKGVIPRPIQVNGLIGAWLRSGTAANIERAEMAAWAMINSRIQFVQTRSQLRGRDQHISLRMTGAGWPKATLETFSLLAENYKDRRLPDKVMELWQALSLAELAPDSFIMNQLLFAMLQNGEGKKVAEFCRTLTTQYKIEPDSRTFLALWQSLTINRLQQLNPAAVSEGIIESRRLFAEMVSHASIFSAEGINHHLARSIMHTFRELRDPIGSLVAYRALRQVFKLSSPGSMVLELLTDIREIGKAAGNPRMRSKLIMATQRIENYLSQRQARMVELGELEKDQELPEEIKTAEMADFLEIHLETQVSTLENAEALFREAAQEMGVYGPLPDDVD